jgi:outer membrane receptor for ferrienterochelin and colicins
VNRKQTRVLARSSLAAAIGALFLSPGGSFAADAPKQGAQLQDVVVTASGFEQVIADAPASISVITREELENKPFRDLTDALRDVEGVAVTGVANEKDIYIRGLPGAYTLILVDGKRQSTRDARTNGNAGFEQSFIPPLEAIERVEVVRGPMSSLYGSDAMGGVINIITRKVSDTWGGSVGLDYTGQQHDESGDSYQGQFYLSGPIKTDMLGLQVWGRHSRRDEDRILNGFDGGREQNVTARLALSPNSQHDILLEAGRTKIERESSPGYTLESDARNTANTHWRDHYSLSHAGRWSWGSTDVSLLHETTERKAYTENAAGVMAQNARAPEITNTVFDAKANMPLGDHWLVFGVQWNEGELTDQNPGRRTGIDEQFSITQKAIFIEDEWRITDRFALTGGARLDHHEVYGSHWSPRLYGVWHSTDEVTLKGGVSRGFRAPDIRTISPGYAYTTGGGGCTYGPNGTCGVIIGDPNLKPETSTNYEISAHLNRENYGGSATFFYTDFKDKVSNALVYESPGVPARWSEDPNYRLWYNFNVDNATIRGIELTARWQPTYRLSLKSSYTYTDSEQKGGTFDGFPLARTPKHMANLRADWAQSDALRFWGSVNHHGKEINAAARSGNNGVELTDNVMQYDDYTLVDIGASYAINKNTTINAAIYNIGDKQLDEVTYNTIGDGRRFWVGVSTRF